MRRRSAAAAIGLTTTGADAFDGDHLTAAERAGARRPETIAARQRIFGVENVDPTTGLLPRDRVIASWTTNSSFALAVGGRVVLLDTFVTRLEVTPGRTPFVIKDLVDVGPHAIVLGHGHFDHAENAAYVAAKTGAPLYASEETCGVMRSDFERMRSDPAIQNDPVARFPSGAVLNLVPVTTTDSTPGTQVLRLNFLEHRALTSSRRSARQHRAVSSGAQPSSSVASRLSTPDSSVERSRRLVSFGRRRARRA